MKNLKKEISNLLHQIEAKNGYGNIVIDHGEIKLVWSLNVYNGSGLIQGYYAPEFIYDDDEVERLYILSTKSDYAAHCFEMDTLLENIS